MDLRARNVEAKETTDWRLVCQWRRAVRMHNIHAENKFWRKVLEKDRSARTKRAARKAMHEVSRWQ